MNLSFKKRNVFDLTHDRKFTCKMGQLVPVLCEEMVPNDKFIGRTDLILRLSPMLAPIMHRVDVFTHFWFVPTRLLQDDWEKFITGGKDGQDNTVIPTIKAPKTTGWLPGSLADYLGDTTGVAEMESLAFPYRAYNLIFNQWYRDENLQDEVSLSLGNGSDTTTNTDILYRCWQKDYFTNALPWPQRGPSVRLPLGDIAPVKVFGNGKSLGITDGTDKAGVYAGGSSTYSQLFARKQMFGKNVGDEVDTQIQLDDKLGNNKAISLVGKGFESGVSGEADLSEATASTINSIRQAFQLQKWFELSAISGCRYVEQILAHFGINCGDARLGRCEFIGGGRSPIIISEIVQTSQSTENSPQGNLAGHGFTANRSHTFKWTAPEHGYIIGIMSVMPKPAYQQGQRRMFGRRSRFDFLWPVFSHLGNQEIKNKEIFAQGDSVVDEYGEIVDEKPFGFTGRYDEYRYIPSSVHGEFKTSLNYWHLGRIFDNLPALNSDFVKCQPAERPFAVQDADVCRVQILNTITAIRPLPKKAIPGFVDHN